MPKHLISIHGSCLVHTSQTCNSIRTRITRLDDGVKISISPKPHPAIQQSAKLLQQWGEELAQWNNINALPKIEASAWSDMPDLFKFVLDMLKGTR